MLNSHGKTIAMIAIMGSNRVIGRDNKMPWHIRRDLAHFKQTTMGKPIIMGRKTLQSIGQALPGRLNIVLTRDKSFFAPGVEIVHTAQLALDRCQAADEIMIIGGGEIYQMFLPIANKLHLTLINSDVAGDAFFPVIDTANWHEVSREDFPTDADSKYPYSFVTLERKDLLSTQSVAVACHCEQA